LLSCLSCLGNQQINKISKSTNKQINKKYIQMKIIKKIIFILACIAFYASFTGCSIDPDIPPRTGMVTAITIEEAVYDASINWMRITLRSNETLQLTPFIMPRQADNPRVSFSNNNPDLMTVSETGLITPRTNRSFGIDTLTVSATDGSGITVRYQVVITDHMVPASAISVTAEGANMFLRVGRAPFDLGATVSLLPTDTYDKRISFTSNDESIVTVTPEGMVTAVALGTTTITIRTLDGSNLSRDVNVTVQEEIQVWNDFPRGDWTVTTTVAALYAPLPFGFVPDGFAGPAGEQTHTNGFPGAILSDDPATFLSFMKLGRGAWNLANVNRAPQYQFAIPNQTIMPAFIVDMGEEQTFNYIIWRHRQWNWTAIWFGARIFGSNDGDNWTQIRSDVHEAGDSDILWIPNPNPNMFTGGQFSITAANNETYRLIVDESTYRFVKVEMASFSDIYGQPGQYFHPDFPGIANNANGTVNVSIFGLGYMYWD
jgi:hypothetical protein